MIGRLVPFVSLVIAYMCVGTVAAALVGFGWLASQGRFDGDRGQALLTLLRGEEPPREAPPAPPPEPDVADVEEPSYEARQAARDAAQRDLEMRELALEQGLKNLFFEQQKISDERARWEVVRKGFEQELKELREGALVAAQANVQQTIEYLTPKQAKQQLLEMMTGGQIGYVVSLLTAMPIDKRADILNEFKAGDEPQKLAEILREMGQGDPEKSLVDQTQAKLTSPPPTEP